MHEPLTRADDEHRKAKAMPRLTKTAKTAQIAAAYEARLRAALHWADDAPTPDVAPPSGGWKELPTDYVSTDYVSTWNVLTTGYVFNAHAQRVDVACSSSIGHTIGRTDDTVSQGSLRMYSTRRLALQALRAALQRECAERLMRVELMIEAEGSE